MKLNFLIPILIFFSTTIHAATNYTSPNMNLVIPIPGQELGPAWANDINASLTLIDAHDHSSGSGVQVTPAGLNINSDLAFNGNFAQTLGAGVFSVQLSDPAETACVYSKGVDLYYKDGNGNVIQITSGGGVAGSPGSISNLTAPASASYVSASGTFVWQQGVSTAANMDAATLIVRYPGSYPVPSGNYIALQAPTSLATGFALTLPPTLPAASSFLTTSTSGTISYTAVKAPTVQKLASGTGTYTTPAGVFYLEVTMVGAGGGGGANSSSGTACGGGAGAKIETLITAPASTIAYGVGAAGTGGVSAGTGVTGGDTTFGANTARGGVGGTASTIGRAGVGGTYTLSLGTDIGSGNGNSGSCVSNASGVGVAGGMGGPGWFGGVGIGTVGSNNTGSSAIVNSGAGGNGGSSTTGAGGAGGSGVIYVKEHYY